MTRAVRTSTQGDATSTVAANAVDDGVDRTVRRPVAGVRPSRPNRAADVGRRPLGTDGDHRAPTRSARRPDAGQVRRRVRVRLRDGGLVSLTGRDLSALQAALARYPRIVDRAVFSSVRRTISAAEKAANEARTGQPQPDLNLYYRLTLAEGVDPGAVIADLGGLEVVERAYADPVAAPPLPRADA